MKKKQIAIFLLSAISAVSLSLGGLSVYHTAKAQETEVDNVIEKIESEYKLGETIQVPDAYFENGQIKAKKTIIYPDGSQYRKDEFTPTVMGTYYVEYSAVSSTGQYLSERKEIYVYDDLYSVKNPTDKLYYGTNELTPNTYGLNIGLEDSSSFYYNKVIDLKNFANKPFISFYMAPEKVKEADGLDLIITLTDAYDASNYVDIWVRSTREYSTWQHGASYISAGAAFQTRAGLEWGTRLHQDNLWGFGQDFTFFGCTTKGEVNEATLTSKTRSNGQLQLFFDYDTKILKTQGNNAGFNEVIDLDNPEYFTELWNGFTTGEAYLSITAKAVSKTHLNFVVTEIGGDDLTVNKTVDTGAPYIAVDTLGYDVLPQAVTGHPYPVFNATAKDAYSGDLNVSVAVYMNYGSPSQSNVNIIDGKFIPTTAGKYYIVYSAKDYSENYGEEVVTVVCESQGEEILLEVEEEGRVTSANLGEYVKLPAYAAAGGNGEVHVTKAVTDANGNQVEIVDNEFKVLTAGTYTVTYTATDFVGVEKVYSYTIQTSLSDKPVFDKDPVLPKYIIGGYEYIIPELKAFDYSNGEQAVPVSIKVTDDDGEHTLDNSRKMTFNVKNAGEIKTFTITYTATSSVGSASKSFEVCVISAKQMINGAQRLDASKYFYSEDVVVQAEKTGVKLTSSNAGKVEFINPLVASGLAFKFAMVNTSALGGLKITLEDSVDATKQISLLLMDNGADKTSYTVNNGGVAYVVSIPYTNGEFNLTYDSENKFVSLDGTNFVLLKNFLDGSEFNGFTSNKVRLYVEFIDVKGEVSVAVKEINSQEFNTTTVMDRVSPWVVTESIGSRVKNIGETITMKPALVGDVLDPSAQLLVRVLAPNGKPIEAVDGTLLSNVSGDKTYQFKISDYGNYRIIYFATDASGNETEYSILVRVVDVESPSITLSRENVSAAKKNTTIVVAPIAVSDNNSAVENVTVCYFITRPNGMKFAIDMENCNSFVANEVGAYIIHYMAFDEMGNISILENVITVTE